jgi:hypothetical protein
MNEIKVITGKYDDDLLAQMLERVPGKPRRAETLEKWRSRQAAKWRDRQ